MTAIMANTRGLEGNSRSEKYIFNVLERQVLIVFKRSEREKERKRESDKEKVRALGEGFCTFNMHLKCWS